MKPTRIVLALCLMATAGCGGEGSGGEAPAAAPAASPAPAAKPAPAPDPRAAAAASPVACAALLAPTVAGDEVGSLAEVGVWYAKTGERAEALEWLDRAAREEFTADSWRRVALKHLEAGLVDEGIALVAKIEDQRERGYAQKRLVEKLLETGDRARAAALAGAIDEQVYKDKAAAALAAQAPGSDVPTAEQLSKRAREALARKASCDKGSALISIASDHAKAGLKERAAELAREGLVASSVEMKRKDARCKVLASQIREAARAGACEDAAELVHWLEPSSQPRAMVDMAERCLEGGRKDGAVNLLDTALDFVGSDETGLEKSPLWRDIAGIYARAGEDARALEVASKVPAASRFKPDALLAVVLGHLEHAGGPTESDDERELLAGVLSQIPE